MDTFILLFLATILILVVIGFVQMRKHMPIGVMDNDTEKEKDRLLTENARLTATLEQKTSRVAAVETELKTAQQEKSELEGSGKQVWAAKTKLESECQQLRERNAETTTRLAEHDEAAARREKEFQERIEKLERAEKKLESEQVRVQASEEARREQHIADRDRMWKEHEDAVYARLRELCQKPELAFTSYANNDLPDGWDGKLRPDFMIEFLGQHIIFDAKMSKSTNLEVYIKDQFKKTALKIKGNAHIYPTIFLVVPTDAISEIKSLYAYQDGISFYVISPEALAPILAAFKKISNYEFAEQFDPQERENVVKVLSRFEWFIRNQNAANILLAEQAIDVIEDKRVLSKDLQDDISAKRSEIKQPFKLKDADMKKLTKSLEEQAAKVNSLTAPKAPIEQSELAQAASLFDEK